ncbi:Translation initiation factor SUI1 family protein [Trichomonas vaginalis G3]|uniref:Translation initiation factor SUI1 family protein n=1 Tax=Trichomonas vaginalis (strain ATCC PRA-98 / G3) TaxID=412133 RepID=A2E6A2_TRIV3|nr:density-regulated (DENR) protein family [Trichomonas vaginalis G3]EAY11825.1 Translation initiation factor SUI1 family protein [Trichomonas vaginalis G3]KAI5534243.1 density-regulated (DENR) protein family [Trichomonas vaginalis G3]|eukprot:XP_001324048.1 Translation initiation factor SUI1 family protein [Trichomonas vaginalis G3]
MAEEEVKEVPVLQKATVEYCPKCDVPLCYCRFFKLHGEGGEGEAEGEDAEAEAEDKKAPAKGGKNAKKGAAKDPKDLPKIQIIVKNRRARKFLTTVSMIEPWGLDLKELTKAISKKMSTSCSTKKKDGMTQIIVQGDAQQPLKDILKTQFKVPLTSIQVTIKQKKKPEPDQPPPQGRFNEEEDDDSD